LGNDILSHDLVDTRDIYQMNLKLFSKFLSSLNGWLWKKKADFLMQLLLITA
jgi:hypothetical protein